MPGVGEVVEVVTATVKVWPPTVSGDDRVKVPAPAPSGLSTVTEPDDPPVEMVTDQVQSMPPELFQVSAEPGLHSPPPPMPPMGFTGWTHIVSDEIDQGGGGGGVGVQVPVMTAGPLATGADQAPYGGPGGDQAPTVGV